MKLAQGVGQQPSSPVGSASRSLSGNQANKVVFNGFPSEYSGPQSAKAGLFSVGEPASVLKEPQVLWQVLTILPFDAGMGKEEDGVGVLVSRLLVLCLLERCLVLFLVMWSLILGTCSFAGAVTAPSGAETEFSNTQFCGAFVAPFGSETHPHDSQFCGVTVVPSGAETEPNGARVHCAAASPVAIETDLENAQFDGAVASPSGFETELKDAQFDDMVASPSGFETEVKVAQCCDAGAKSGFTNPRSRGSWWRLLHLFAVWILEKVSQVTFLVNGKEELRLVLARASKRVLRAGSTCLDDLFVSCRVEDPSSRVARVNTALQNLCLVHSSFIPAHNSHARMPHARCVVNSVGDAEDGGRLSCVSGGRVLGAGSGILLCMSPLIHSRRL